jgi:hypothetical protein
MEIATQKHIESKIVMVREVQVTALVSQNAIPSKQSLGGYLRYVFSEQGVANEILKRIK